MKRQEYQEILQKGLLPSRNKLCSGEEVIFQQDNDKAKTTMSLKQHSLTLIP